MNGVSGTNQRGRRRAPHDPNTTRLTELSRIARDLYRYGTNDYVLPETREGRALAEAIITHLYRGSPRRNGHWLFNYCNEHAPWLDPNEIDLATLKPEKAGPLGIKIELTAEVRTRVRITTIRPCDLNAWEFKTWTQKRRRQHDRDRKRRKREAAGRTRRAEWEAASISRTRPWIAEGIGRSTWYRRKKLGTAANIISTDDYTAARLAQSQPVETSVSARRTLVASGHTCLTENEANMDSRFLEVLKHLRPNRCGAYTIPDLLFDLGIDVVPYFKAGTIKSYGEYLRLDPAVSQHFDNGTLARVDMHGLPCRQGDYFKITEVGLAALAAYEHAKRDDSNTIAPRYRKAA